MTGNDVVRYLVITVCLLAAYFLGFFVGRKPK